MVFFYEHKIIIKYLRLKHGYGATRILNDHPESNWNLGGVKKLLAKTDKTGSIERQEGSGRPKTMSWSKNVS